MPSLGRERADDIARRALRDWATEHGKNIGRLFEGTGVEKAANSFPLFTKDACNYEVVKDSPDDYRMNVHRCRYAEFFKGIGETEIGSMIWCGADFPVAVAIGSDVRLERTQTIMTGGKFCNFRYYDPAKHNEER